MVWDLFEPFFSLERRTSIDVSLVVYDERHTRMDLMPSVMVMKSGVAPNCLYISMMNLSFGFPLKSAREENSQPRFAPKPCQSSPCVIQSHQIQSTPTCRYGITIGAGVFRCVADVLRLVNHLINSARKHGWVWGCHVHLMEICAMRTVNLPRSRDFDHRLGGYVLLCILRHTVPSPVLHVSSI